MTTTVTHTVSRTGSVGDRAARSAAAAARRSATPIAAVAPVEPQFLAGDHRLSLFEGLSAEDVEALAGATQIMQAPPGTLVFGDGQPVDSLYIVLAGRVKVLWRAPDGRPPLLALVGPGEDFGEPPLFDPRPATTTAVTVTHTRLARLDMTALHHLAQTRPQIATRLLQMLARRVRRTQTRLEDLILLDVAGRVAKQLVHLAGTDGSTGDGQVRVRHDLSQQELAQLVGASREAVNKTLSDFAARGWIRVEARTVLILDLARLSHRAR